MLSDLFVQEQLRNNDWQNAQTIAAQMQAENQKAQMQRWKLVQDTQTAIFEIQQQVTVHRAEVQDKAYKKWDDYIRG